MPSHQAVGAAVLLAISVGAPALAASARFDLDVDPEDVQVYVDGSHRGEADDFDDSPDYLWLPPGEHALEFRLRGYQTLQVLLVARSGEERRLGYDLRKGSSADVRVVDLRPSGSAGGPAPPMPPGDPAAANVRFLVQPADAAVWVDDIFLGAAASFDGSKQIAHLPPGRHAVELTRPGYRTSVLTLQMRAGEERTVRVTMEPQPE